MSSAASVSSTDRRHRLMAGMRSERQQRASNRAAGLGSPATGNCPNTSRFDHVLVTSAFRARLAADSLRGRQRTTTELVISA